MKSLCHQILESMLKKYKSKYARYIKFEKYGKNKFKISIIPLPKCSLYFEILSSSLYVV